MKKFFFFKLFLLFNKNKEYEIEFCKKKTLSAELKIYWLKYKWVYIYSKILLSSKYQAYGFNKLLLSSHFELHLVVWYWDEVIHIILLLLLPGPLLPEVILPVRVSFRGQIDLFVLDRNTWYHMIVFKLFVLDRKTWYHITENYLY